MLKLNVGFNRKIGEPGYGSRGAAVNLELELDSGLAGNPERLQERIRQMFELARASVQEELGGGADRPEADRESSRPTNGQHGSNGQAHRNGHPPASTTRAPARPATASQVRALWAIAEGLGIDLGSQLRADYAIERPEELSISQASQLIESLRSDRQGNGNGQVARGHR